MTAIATVPQAAAARRSSRWSPSAARTAKYAALVVFLIVFLTPMYVLAVTSVKSLDEISPSKAWNLPSHMTLDAWREAWDQLRPALTNSFKLAIPAVFFSTMLGSLNGFVLSKWRFPGADWVFTFFLFGMFIPYQAVMIPLSQLYNGIGVDPGLGRLIFAHIVYGIPITTLIFRNYYATIPDELMEAARMDGAGMFRSYWSIVLPNSAPAFVVAGIWQFTSIWNDFLFAVFLVTNPKDYVVTVALNNSTGALVTPFNLQMAGALLASVPTLVVYIVLGRYFMRGLMAGALKG
jgi:glucose/mannose transport system permease protein